MAVRSFQYDTFSLLLHWSLTILIFAIGFSAPFMDHRSQNGLIVFIGQFHIIGGYVVLGLAVISVIWWASRQVPPPIADIEAGEQRWMKLAVRTMVILLFLSPLTGIAYLAAVGQGLELGPWKIAFDTGLGRPALNWLSLTHHVVSAALVMLGGAHSLHVVWHHMVREDSLIGRMIPWHRL